MKAADHVRYWAIAKKRAFVSAIVVLATELVAQKSVWAEDIPLVAPMNDFVIYEPPDPPGPEGVKFYSPTGHAPAWSVAQWNMPLEKLSPFSVTGKGPDRYMKASSTEATVEISGMGGDTVVYLEQDGSVLPCLDKGHPRESDLLIGPNGDTLRGASSGMLLAAHERPKLSNMKSLMLRITAFAAFQMAKESKRCEVNQAAATIGLALSNISDRAPQTLFYQLALSRFCGPWPVERAKICSGLSQKPLFFSDHNPFGSDDYLPLLGQSYLRAGERRSLQLDLLPRLRLVFEIGPEALDKDLSHWYISGVYLGEGIWGDVHAKTSWTGFGLSATPLTR